MAEGPNIGGPVPYLPLDDRSSVYVDELGIRYLLTADQTSGRLTLLDIPCAPHKVVAPVHTHTLEDEYQMVLAGTICFELAGKTITAQPGDMVTQLRGEPMAIWNPGDEPGRLLSLFSPGGYDRYLKAVTPHIVAGNAAEILPLGKEYGVQSDPSSIPRLVQEHGLDR